METSTVLGMLAVILAADGIHLAMAFSVRSKAQAARHEASAAEDTAEDAVETAEAAEDLARRTSRDLAELEAGTTDGGQDD